MRRCAPIVLALCILLAAGGCLRAEPSMKTLLKQHPRLIVTEADLQRTRQLIESDAAVRKLAERLRGECKKLLDEPPVERVLIGPRLLSVSRRCLQRVYVLAGMYRLEGDRRYAERAIREMLAAAAFADWNPSHFLDVAEMTHALGIGYDWLYDVMTPVQRTAVRRGIVEHGLLAALKAHKQNAWFFRSAFNWNQVCSGGILVGALAVGDEEPALAADLVGRLTKSVQAALASYAPDGGWAEGPGYWDYATSYTVYTLAALQTALADTGGLQKSAGLDAAGMFRIHTTGPGGLVFNYADCGERVGRCAAMYWLAREFKRPLYAWHERQETRSPEPLDLFWYDPDGQGPAAMKLPTDAWFRGVQVVTLRGAWEDPAAVYVAMKGGDNAANHGHLDLGTFVLDADGVRWAMDLGGDSYALPEYFGALRWTYYRMRTEGHNTLTLDGANQETKARAAVVAYRSGPRRSHGVVDLAAAYGGAFSSARRGLALLDAAAVLVQDDLVAARPAAVEWAMHTQAGIAANGRVAELTREGKKLRATILSPPGATFAVQPVSLRKPQNPTAGVMKLLIDVRAEKGPLRIAVLLSPYRGHDAPPTTEAALTPLSDWGN